MSRSIPVCRNGSARGFVLVGVVMLVLALTILGLSLFSLSSFESQFLGRSLDGACAFHAANGGLDRARFALAATESLQSVRAGLPEHVVSTTAFQEQESGDTLTTGQVLWGGGPVVIRVVAECNGTRRAVEAQFTPQRPEDPYTRLITSSSWVTVPQNVLVDAVGVDRRPQTWLSGPVLQASGPTDWTNSIGSSSPPISGPVPSPDVRTFLASNWGTAVDVEVRSSCTLHASGRHGFFKTGYVSSGVWSFKNASQTYIDVTGRVVWMFDRGFRSDGFVTVHGDRDTDCLVMVAEPGGVGDGPGGIVFKGGLWSNIPLVLVSDGEVWIWDFPGTSDSQAEVSIYADGVSILGPLHEDSDGDGTLDFLRLSYGLSGALLTALHGDQLLPVASLGALSEFARVPGRWREFPPGN